MGKRRTRFKPFSEPTSSSRCCKWASSSTSSSSGRDDDGSKELVHIIDEQSRDREKQRAFELSVPVRRAQPLQVIMRQEVLGNKMKARLAYHRKQVAEARQRKEQEAHRREVTESLRRVALEELTEEKPKSVPSSKRRGKRKEPQARVLGDFIPPEVATFDRTYDADTWALPSTCRGGA